MSSPSSLVIITLSLGVVIQGFRLYVIADYQADKERATPGNDLMACN